jgi:hypothetical protein
LDSSTGTSKGFGSNGFYKGVTEQLIRYAKGWVKYETESPEYEVQKGSGEYRSLGQVLRETKRAHKIDDYHPSPEHNYLVEEFWTLKGYVGDLDKPIRHEDMSHTLLDRNERYIMLATDRAFRSALSETRRKNDKYLAGKYK